MVLRDDPGADNIPVRKVLEGLGVKHIFETDIYQQSVLTELVQKALEIPEFSVVIARHPCMLKFRREQRKKFGFIAQLLSAVRTAR